MKEIFPEDIRFTPERATAVASDLFTDAFMSSRDARSEEYKSGFRAAAFNRLLAADFTHLYVKAAFPKGSCQLDAWFSGYDEGQLAACSFQIHFLDTQHSEKNPLSTGNGPVIDNKHISFSFT